MGVSAWYHRGHFKCKLHFRVISIPMQGARFSHSHPWQSLFRPTKVGGMQLPKHIQCLQTLRAFLGGDSQALALEVKAWWKLGYKSGKKKYLAVRVKSCHYLLWNIHFPVCVSSELQFMWLVQYIYWIYYRSHINIYKHIICHIYLYINIIYITQVLHIYIFKYTIYTYI